MWGWGTFHPIKLMWADRQEKKPSEAMVVIGLHQNGNGFQKAQVGTRAKDSAENRNGCSLLRSARLAAW
jgi:hypothetical protein